MSDKYQANLDELYHEIAEMWYLTAVQVRTDCWCGERKAHDGWKKCLRQRAKDIRGGKKLLDDEERERFQNLTERLSTMKFEHPVQRWWGDAKRGLALMPVDAWAKHVSKLHKTGEEKAARALQVMREQGLEELEGPNEAA